jgi:hypothetical protein
MATFDAGSSLKSNNRDTYSFILTHGDLLVVHTLNISSTGSTRTLHTRCQKREQKSFLSMDQQTYAFSEG